VVGDIMNSLEFKELQNEMGDLLYKYESFLKKSHIIDCKIVNEYGDLILESLCLRNENSMLAHVCQMLNDKKSLDEVDAYIKDLRDKHQTSLSNLAKKREYVKTLVERLKDEEATKELEERFKELVKENHPAVKILITKVERMTYDQLRKCYLDNNLVEYESYLKLQESFIRPCTLTEKDYNNANQNYYQIRNNIAAEMNKKKNEYPLVLENVFENEMTIASHRANYIIDNNRLKADNKGLHQNVVSIYGEDITL
jgi:hypothetical protein